MLIVSTYKQLASTYVNKYLTPFQILDASKLRQFADDNFKFNENGRKSSKGIEITVMSNFSFFHSFFKRVILQTRKNQGLFGKGLKNQD